MSNLDKKTSRGTWFASGKPWIFLNAGAISISLIMVFGLLGLIAYNGLAYFWPDDVISSTYHHPNKKATIVLGQIQIAKEIPGKILKESKIKIPDLNKSYTRYWIKGNHSLGESSFKTYLQVFLKETSKPKDVAVIERRTGGNYYGYIVGLKSKNVNTEVTAGSRHPQVEAAINRASSLHTEMTSIKKNEIGSINYKKANLIRYKKKLVWQLEKHSITQTKFDQAVATIAKDDKKLDAEYNIQIAKLDKLGKKIRRDILLVRNEYGKTQELKLSNVIRYYHVNQLGVFGKSGVFLTRFWEFLTEEPRETIEGGIYPAIFGTVVMVILMSILVTPLGVIAAIYLHEYAKQGTLTRIIRISVNNLAGVPSIVYGVFGLGFFVYFLGGSIDALFYPELVRDKIATFGTPALIWASLTLALLTLPVVIVATEEGLSRVPRSMREGSLALGATRAETLWRTIIPMASPGIITGLILAIARAAGEVAPLMLVGVVKSSPTLPLDLNAPFIHFDRTIMHMGFHIYDVGFLSQDSVASKPLVFATAFVLVMVIVILNLAAISIRNKLRERYKSIEG